MHKPCAESSPPDVAALCGRSSGSRAGVSYLCEMIRQLRAMTSRRRDGSGQKWGCPPSPVTRSDWVPGNRSAAVGSRSIAGRLATCWGQAQENVWPADGPAADRTRRSDRRCAPRSFPPGVTHPRGQGLGPFSDYWPTHLLPSTPPCFPPLFPSLPSSLHHIT